MNFIVTVNVEHFFTGKYGYDYDIAILRTEPLTFNSRVAPVCLPDDLTVDYVGKTATVAGWGATSEGSSYFSSYSEPGRMTME